VNQKALGQRRVSFDRKQGFKKRMALGSLDCQNRLEPFAQGDAEHFDHFLV
jgi:hypothetical protein